MTGTRSSCRYAGVVLLLLSFSGHAVEPASRYRIASDDSELRILVYRAGALAKLGHNHVIATRNLSGEIILGTAPGGSSFDLEFPVASLEVDDADLRAEEGPEFSSAVDAEDSAGTRRNMLGPKLLDADTHSQIQITSSTIKGDFPNVVVTVVLTVKGSEHELLVPASINTFDGGLIAIGRLRIGHEDIGLTPFQARFGALRVADELLVKFRIVAREKGT